MVIVKDTHTFIQKARQVHGDKYDYSETVYFGSQKPITIRCRRCGTFQLSQAGSHYRSKKPCGCRRCERMDGEFKRKGDIAKCRGCDKVSPYKQGGFCASCRDLGFARSALRIAEKQLKHTKQCRGCGVEFSDRRRSYCTDECRLKYISKPIRMQCGYCGNEIWKHRRPSEQIHKARFCNRKCQRAYRTKLSNIARRECFDWQERSRLAKRKWKEKHSVKRRKEWRRRGGRIWCDVFVALSQASYEPAFKDWRCRFNSMVACNRYRESLSVQRMQVKGESRKSMKSALRSLVKVKVLKERDKWIAKLNNIASNQRRRMKVKSLRQALKS
jgi:hypothetical protein